MQVRNFKPEKVELNMNKITIILGVLSNWLHV